MKAPAGDPLDAVVRASPGLLLRSELGRGA